MWVRAPSPVQPVRSTGSELYKSPPDGFFEPFFLAGFAAVSVGCGATGFNFASFFSLAACAC